MRVQLLIATLPLFPLVLVLKPIKSVFDHPGWLGFGFLITALILFIGNRFAAKEKTQAPYRDALFIGIAQAFAIVPGISRSGATISAARLRGFQPLQAALFSFILSLLTVIGGMGLESIKLMHGEQQTAAIPLYCYITGGATALLVGIFTLRLLLRIVGTAKFQLFTWYCALLGLLTLYYFS